MSDSPKVVTQAGTSQTKTPETELSREEAGFRLRATLAKVMAGAIMLKRAPRVAAAELATDEEPES